MTVAKPVAWALESIESRLWGRARRDPRTGCLIFRGCLVDGYGTVSYNGQRWRAHRLAYALAIGPIPDGAMILHGRACNGRRACIEPSHSRPGSARENSADMVAFGRVIRGQKCHSAKLSPALVRRIRRQSTHATRVELARRHGVARSTIWAVAVGKTWAWVDQGVAA
jgi:hypothetical protein